MSVASRRRGRKSTAPAYRTFASRPLFITPALPYASARMAGFDPRFFELLDAAEDKHFWFRARSRIAGELARQITQNLPPGHRILELGCGHGGMLRILRNVCPNATLIGMDLFAEGLRYSRQRIDCPLVQANVHHHPFGVHFDLIGLFDVLEHLDDDRGVLRSIHALLNDGAALLLTVPAHQHLWSYFDEASHHCRRYSRRELHDKLVECGFAVEYLTEYMAPIYPIVAAARRFQGLTGGTTSAADLTAREMRIVPGLNTVLDRLLARELFKVRRRTQISPGTSIIAIARRAPACQH